MRATVQFLQLGLYRTALAAACCFSEIKFSRLGKMANRGLRSMTERNSPLGDGQGLPQSWSTSENDYEKQFPSLSSSISQVPKGKRRLRVDLGIPPSEQRSEEVLNSTRLQLESPNSINEQNDTDLPTSVGKNSGSSSSNRKLHQTYHEQRSEEVQSIVPLQLESPKSMNYQNDTDLPTSFGKNRVSFSRNHKHRQAYHEKWSEDVQRVVPLQLKSPNSINDQNDTDSPTSFRKKHVSSSRNRKLYQHENVEAKRSSTSPPNTTISEPFDICFPETRESNSWKKSANRKNRKWWVQKIQSAEEGVQNRDITENGNNILDSVEPTGQVLRPGMVLFKHYVPLSEQVDIVNRCRELGRGPGGFYQPGYYDGAKLRLYMMCLGLDWNPQTRRYGEIRHHDNVAPPDIPNEFTSLVCRVLDDSHTIIRRDLSIMNAEEILPGMSPDVCIVNFYNSNGRLGLHKDRDESKESLLKGLPVVSISVGDSAEFLYGDQRDVDEADSVLLESGDVVIFGGESRHVFHGVKTIIPNTAPPALLKNTRLRPGRLNLTFRQY